MAEAKKSDRGPGQDRYTVKEVARIFNLTESRLRYWAQTGFLNPEIRHGARVYYTFTDLIGIKTAKDLLDSGLSLQKVRKQLAMLRKALPDIKKPLSRLRIRSDGERLVVVSEDAVYEADTRQVLLDIQTGRLHDEVARVLNLARPVLDRRPAMEKAAPKGGGDRHSAYRWFLEGLRLEEQDAEIEESAACYRRALELDSGLSAAHTNLGNIYYRQGLVADARAHYERALALDPDQPEARFNLGNIHEAEGRLELAIAEYRRVVASNPEFSDAHFNLGLCLEEVGARPEARTCFERYLEMEGDEASLWCRLARDHLIRLNS